MNVIFHDPRATIEDLGLLPSFLSESCEQSATEQLNRHYSHGGGWHSFRGFELFPDDSIQYPDDPVLRPLAEMRLRDERVIIYPCSWVLVMQPDRSFEICRMD